MARIFTYKRCTQILALSVLMLCGCAVIVENSGGSGLGSGNESFVSYNSGENPERYCEQPGRLAANQVVASCVHELIVFDRARRGCEGSGADRRCISRNQQLWQQEVAKARDLVQQLSGGSYDETGFHEQMRTPAERFVIRCKQANGELKACGVK